MYGPFLHPLLPGVTGAGLTESSWTTMTDPGVSGTDPLGMQSSESAT